MTNKEAIECIDNLIICIKEHPVVADWLVEIADRKTESDSEKPNNCETCGTPKHLCQYCIAEDRMWTPKTEPQKICKYCNGKCSWWVDGDCMNDDCRFKPKDEPFDKDINVFNKTENPCNTCANKGDHNGECSNCFACSEPIRWKTPSRYKPKVEPQIDTNFTLTYTCCFSDCENFKHFGFGEKCIECKRKQKMWKTEPRTMYYPQVDGITLSVIVPQTDKENE